MFVAKYRNFRFIFYRNYSHEKKLQSEKHLKKKRKNWCHGDGFSCQRNNLCWLLKFK